MFIVCLTIFSSILSPLQSVSYIKVHVYCVFDYFLFNLVSTSVCELHKSACLLCVWLFSLQSCLHFSHVSYVKVHVYVFDYFLFNLVSTSGRELRESACLLCVWLFSFQSCLHFRLWVTWKCMFIVCLTIFTPLQVIEKVMSCFYFLFNLVTSGGELRESACIVCLTIFSSILSPLQEESPTGKCMFIVCLTIFSSILSPLQHGELRESACLLCVWLFSLSILSVTLGGQLRESDVYCVFDYFLFNLVSTSGGELRESACLLCDTFTILSTLVNYIPQLRESACLLCVWLFSLQSCLHFRVSYVKVHIYCVFDYFLFAALSYHKTSVQDSLCVSETS